MNQRIDSYEDTLWNDLDRHKEYLLRPDTSAVSHFASPTNRDIGQIALIHNMADDDFINLVRNSSILDIGGGHSMIQHQLNIQNITSRTVCLDLPSTFVCNTSANVRDERQVAGLAQNLPFKGGSFDTVISTYAMPYYVTSTAMIDAFFSEALRVTKPQGTICLSPFTLLSGNKLETKSIVESHLIGALQELRTNPTLKLTLKKNDHLSVQIRKIQ